MKAISALYFRAITILATSALASLSGSAQIAMPQQSVTSGEAAGYFAGSKTVEEASKLIQSRVSLYIQEQK